MSGIGLGGGQDRFLSEETGTPAGPSGPENGSVASGVGANGAAQKEIDRLKSALERKNKEVEDMALTLNLLETETRWRVENAEKKKKKEVDSAESNVAFKAQELKRSEMARKGLQKSLRKAHVELVRLRNAAKEQHQGNCDAGGAQYGKNPRKENRMMASTKRSSQSLRPPAMDSSMGSDPRKRMKMASGEGASSQPREQRSLSPSPPASGLTPTPPEFLDSSQLNTGPAHSSEELEGTENPVVSIFAETSADLLVLLGVVHLFDQGAEGAGRESPSRPVLAAAAALPGAEGPAAKGRTPSIGGLLFSPPGPAMGGGATTATPFRASPFSVLRQRHNLGEKGDRLLILSFDLYTQLSRVVSQRDERVSLVPKVLPYLQDEQLPTAYHSAALGVLKRILSLCPLASLLGQRKPPDAAPTTVPASYAHPRLKGIVAPTRAARAYVKRYATTLSFCRSSLGDLAFPKEALDVRLKSVQSVVACLEACIRTFYQHIVAFEGAAEGSGKGGAPRRRAETECLRRMERCVEVFHLIANQCPQETVAGLFQPFIKSEILLQIIQCEDVGVGTKRVCLSILQRLVAIYPIHNTFAWGVPPNHSNVDAVLYEIEENGYVFRILKRACSTFLRVPQSWWKTSATAAGGEKEPVEDFRRSFRSRRLPLIMHTLRSLSAVLAHHEQAGIVKLFSPGRREDNVFILLVGLIEALSSPLQTFDTEIHDEMFHPIREGLVIISVLLTYVYGQEENFHWGIFGQTALDKLTLIQDRVLKFGEERRRRKGEEEESASPLYHCVVEAQNLRSLMSHD